MLSWCYQWVTNVDLQVFILVSLYFIVHMVQLSVGREEFPIRFVVVLMSAYADQKTAIAACCLTTWILESSTECMGLILWDSVLSN